MLMDIQINIGINILQVLFEFFSFVHVKIKVINSTDYSVYAIIYLQIATVQR